MRRSTKERIIRGWWYLSGACWLITVGWWMMWLACVCIVKLHDWLGL